MKYVVAVLRVVVATGAICLLAATAVDEFQSAASNNATVLNATITYGAYKTVIDVGGTTHTTTAKCGAEGNDVAQLNSSEVGTICTAICTTKKVAVVAPVVLAFLAVALLTACTGHGWRSPAFPPDNKARWRGAAWCGIIAAVVYGIALVLYALETGTGPQWGVCRYASDDTSAPSPQVSFTLAAVGAGMVGVASLPFLCLSPTVVNNSEITRSLMG